MAQGRKNNMSGLELPKKTSLPDVPLIAKPDSITILRENICKSCNYLVNNICLIPQTNYCETAEKIEKLLSEK